MARPNSEKLIISPRCVVLKECRELRAGFGEEYGGEGDGDIWREGGNMDQNEEEGDVYDCEED
jgi:hypothetical protein